MYIKHEIAFDVFSLKLSINKSILLVSNTCFQPFIRYTGFVDKFGYSIFLTWSCPNICWWKKLTKKNIWVSKHWHQTKRTIFWNKKNCFQYQAVILHIHFFSIFLFVKCVEKRCFSSHTQENFMQFFRIHVITGKFGY